jgi:hypothetical protein
MTGGTDQWTSLPQTKNPMFANALASFSPVVDCAAPNNRLKRRRFGSRAKSKFRIVPELALKNTI